MISDIYIRNIDDPKYDETKLDVSDEYEMLYSKIVMILGTRAGEVLGDPEFGVSLEDRIFTFNLDEGAIRDEIYSQLERYVQESGQYNIEIQVKRYKGTVRDIILLDFVIDNLKSFGILIK